MHWPDCSSDPSSDEVARFAHDHKDRLSFFQYLQWQCEIQLGAVAEGAAMNGMELGLYGDLAVSVDAIELGSLGQPGMLFVRYAGGSAARSVQ